MVHPAQGACYFRGYIGTKDRGRLKEVRIMAFARFMSQPVGRVIRAVAGLALMALGFVIGGTAGIVVGIVGLVPLAAGVFNFCLVGPLVGGYFDGRKNLEGTPPESRRGAPQH
jgi:hypothetical protein